MSENFDSLFYLPSDSQANETAIASDKDSNDAPHISEEVGDYKHISYHWFYSDTILNKTVWIPMSYRDSTVLERIFMDHKKSIAELRLRAQDNQILDDKYLVCVKGGRFEVDLVNLEKRSIYWEDKNKSEVRRCLWFFKENDDTHYQPYIEEYSEFLETEYEKAIKTNSFHKKITFKSKSNQSNDEEAFIFHTLFTMHHYDQADLLNESGPAKGEGKRPKIVKRGIDDVVEKIEPDEIQEFDHLCFVIHGIGEGCDFKFRPLQDCVDDFRNIGSYIIDSHFKEHIEKNKLSGRIEFLPITWHEELHDQTGVDENLKSITLSSIPKLRQFSNSTILDVLFYTSPIYCQTIISKVGNELNRLSKIFMEKNPNFKGTISLIGHSLGSVILYDLLANQSEVEKQEIETEKTEKGENLDSFLTKLDLIEFKKLFENEKICLKSLELLTESDLISLGIPMGPRKVILNEIKTKLVHKDKIQVQSRIKKNLTRLNSNLSDQTNETNCNYGTAGTGQLIIEYPKLNFKVENFFALGSPIAVFLTVRGEDKITTDFKLPTCSSFFNIFHPFDPVAYRFEPLIHQKVLKPVLMPHHKGRKRMHLELVGLSKAGIDFKEKMVGQLKNAWNSISNFNRIGSSSSNLVSIEQSTSIETSTLIETQPENLDDEKNMDIVSSSESLAQIETDTMEKIDLGKLNQGRRIDYVLQESPFESFNEYIFALAAHLCYWESEDTVLLITKEIYKQGNTMDANSELYLTDYQKQSAGWLTQAATSTINTNLQKTFSYFNMSVPQSITSVLTSSITSTITKPISSLNSTDKADDK
ncbi:phospholipase DDHD2 isoform X1 [Brachionus plicatilis]|uniref:Phospholipase DDHD2 isoform X1 n=1 Tax=Brachionus plicatilis TaxID=10195 RepID=A0A3M7RQ22_BRAPC|nr:phospholipase DDHD2 isoform X1 [Brachionus plicatilis]